MAASGAPERTAPDHDKTALGWIDFEGGLVEMGPLLFDPLHVAFVQHIEGGKYRPKTPIVPAELGERAGAVGAAVLARELLR